MLNIVTSLFSVHNITYILYSISQQVHYCFGHFDNEHRHECINFTISTLLCIQVNLTKAIVEQLRECPKDAPKTPQDACKTS